MKLSIFLDPQEGMTWAAMVAAAERTEAGGFHGLYRSDHLAPTSGHLERAATEAWTTLGALAQRTTRITLGTLITPLTFREPALLSKVVSTVCEMAPSRVEVSIGTGWNAGEHEALGLAFGSWSERFERLEEYIEVLDGLWGQEPFTFEGRYYRVAGILPRPLPVPRPGLIIGGHGRRKTPRLAARFADDYNIDWPSPAMFADLNACLDEACEDVGRDPRSISRSALLGVIVGRDDTEVRRRSETAVAQIGGTSVDAWLAEHADAWRAGTPDRIADWLAGYEAVGLEHAMLMVAPHGDTATIDLLAAEVLPRFV